MKSTIDMIRGISFELSEAYRGKIAVKPELLESIKSVMPTNYRFISLANVANGSIDIEEGQQYITELPKALEKFVVPDNSVEGKARDGVLCKTSGYSFYKYKQIRFRCGLWLTAMFCSW